MGQFYFYYTEPHESTFTGQNCPNIGNCIWFDLKQSQIFKLHISIYQNTTDKTELIRLGTGIIELPRDIIGRTYFFLDH